MSAVGLLGQTQRIVELWRTLPAADGALMEQLITTANYSWHYRTEPPRDTKATVLNYARY